MLCQGLCTLDELEAKEEKEKQIEIEHTANEAAASFSITLQTALRQSSNPFARLDIPLLLPKV